MRGTGPQPSRFQLFPEWLLFLNSDNILLALADAHEDSLLMPGLEPCHFGRVTLRELSGYHRQLFNWNLLRENPGLLLKSAEFLQGGQWATQVRN